MDKIQNSGLDSVAIASISGGVTMLLTDDKWYVGLVAVLVGVGLSLLKYKLRG